MLVFFQLLIIATGNFAFFNLLSITLCIPLLPDPYLSWLLPFVTIPVSDNVLLSHGLSVVAIILIAGNVIVFLNNFITIDFLLPIYRFLYFFRLINPYGLFVHMTRTRNEIIVEGSDDGQLWIPYTFKWKPDDLKKSPKIVAPYQPRLDWQMWFAALSSVNYNQWFLNFLIRLLQGSSDVLKLMSKNPFPDKPPKYVRGTFYKYQFSSLKVKKETGNWWVRNYIGPYSQTIVLKEETKPFKPPETTFTYF